MFVQQADICLNELNKRSIINKVPFTGALFDLFLPNQCLICSKTINAEKILCETCLDELQSIKPSGTYKRTHSIDNIYFYDYYDSPLTTLIKSYKYHPHKILERFLALLLFRLLSYWNLTGTIVPIPSHIASIRSRGFSPVENMVSYCREKFLPAVSTLNIIRRKGDYIPQASIPNHTERKVNAENSYAIIDKELPKKIIIVDDILTSGNTLETVAHLIKTKNTNCQITGVVLVKRGN